jgi:hypothetical protein
MPRSKTLQRSETHYKCSLLRCNAAAIGSLVVVPVVVVMIIAIMMVIVVAMFVTMIAAMFIAMFIAIMRNVHFVVPIVFNEVDLSAAGVVPAAIPAPVACMVGRHM